MSASKISQSKLRKLNGLQGYLNERILGQEQVITRMVSHILRSELGPPRAGLPKGSFLFMGPTGVGKTQLARSFSQYLFAPGKIQRFDMSEFQVQSNLSLLLGDAREDSGRFFQAHERAKSGTWLFDEIEKAHPDILNLLLQIMGDARVTLASGRTLDLSAYYIVCTSNIGSADLIELEHSSYATLERLGLERLKQNMRAELIGRFDEILVFNRLSFEVQLRIARLFVREELKRMASHGHQLEWDPALIPFLVMKGFTRRLGARPMRRTVEKFFGEAVVARLLVGRKGSGRLVIDPSIGGLAIV